MRFCGVILGVLSVVAGSGALVGAKDPVSRRPDTPQGAMPDGLVLVAKVTGDVRQEVRGHRVPLKVDDVLGRGTNVVTAANSHLVLVFSNGATLQLQANSELVLTQFQQEPFSGAVKVAQLKQEPSASRTLLKLERGEVIVDVKALRFERGSYFRIETPEQKVNAISGVTRVAYP